MEQYHWAVDMALEGGCREGNSLLIFLSVLQKVYPYNNLIIIHAITLTLNTVSNLNINKPYRLRNIIKCLTHENIFKSE